MIQKPKNPFQFFEELKRRQVIRVMIVYVASAFAILEAADIIFPRIGFSDEAVNIVMYLLVAGFILSVILSWIYDVTPGGIQKTKPSDEVNQDEKPITSNIWKVTTFVSVLIIFVFVLFYIVGNIQKSIDISRMEKSIAVLPFDNWSHSEEYSHYGDAIANEIISQLSKVQEFHITAFTSASQYGGIDKTPVSQIGKELGVNFLIDGSIERQNEEVNIHVQLIQSKTDENLWGDNYTGPWKDIFKIRAEIAIKIAEELKTLLAPEELEQIEKEPTDNDEAYTHYLLGNHFLFSNSLKAIDHYQKAIELDSCFAQAYTGLAWSYLFMSWINKVLPPSEALPKAKIEALKALELNDNLAEVHFILADIDFYEYKWKSAEQYFKIGLKQNSNYILGRIEYANFLTAMGRFEESIEIGKETIELNPLDPYAYNELQFSLLYNGQGQEALDQLDKMLELDSKSIFGLFAQMQTYASLGQYDLALLNWEKLLEIVNNDIKEFSSFDLGVIGQVLGLVSRKDEAISCLNELEYRIERNEYGQTLPQAFIYIGLGEYEKAIHLLEQSYNERDPSLVHLNNLSFYDPIRSANRFKEIINKMGFEK